MAGLTRRFFARWAEHPHPESFFRAPRMPEESIFTWTCSKCGSTHSGIPDSYAYDAPWPWYTLPERERPSRVFLNDDYCVIDNEDYFIRGCLEIPVIGRTNPLIWGVWVSLSKANFERERQLVNDPIRVNEPPYFGWLSSRIQMYPDTFALKTNVHTRAVGLRPFIELQPTEHPLAVEQGTGISTQRLMEIAENFEHMWQHPDWDAGRF
jgi:hypothetical protein